MCKSPTKGQALRSPALGMSLEPSPGWPALCCRYHRTWQRVRLRNPVVFCWFCSYCSQGGISRSVLAVIVGLGSPNAHGTLKPKDSTPKSSQTVSKHLWISVWGVISAGLTKYEYSPKQRPGCASPGPHDHVPAHQPSGCSSLPLFERLFVALLILLSSSCSPPCGQEHPPSQGFVIPHSPVFSPQKWRSPNTPWILWENVKEKRGQLS